MATDPTEPELDLSWLEEMPADEDEKTGAANQDAAPSNLQLEALLTN